MARVWHRLAAAIVASLLAVGLVNCRGKPVAGGKCTVVGKYVCSDPSSALLCQGGTFVNLPCRGPKGCTGRGSSSECDDDLASEGDACLSTLNESYACSVDHKKELVCKDGKFQLARTCKGPKSCAIQGDTVHCDDSLIDVGDVCMEETGDANYACTPDRKTEVVCRGNKAEISNTCRGNKGCWIEGDTIHCDQDKGREGDVCRPVDNHSCSEDARSELKCAANGHWAKQRDCRHDGCKVKGNEVWCN